MTSTRIQFVNHFYLPLSLILHISKICRVMGKRLCLWFSCVLTSDRHSALCFVSSQCFIITVFDFITALWACFFFFFFFFFFVFFCFLLLFFLFVFFFLFFFFKNTRKTCVQRARTLKKNQRRTQMMLRCLSVFFFFFFFFFFLSLIFCIKACVVGTHTNCNSSG